MRWNRFHGYLETDSGGLEYGREKPMDLKRRHISKGERTVKTWGVEMGA